MFKAKILAAAFLVSSATAAVAMNSGNIVAAASSSPDFKTLVTAVKAAKLTDTLASKGPFTVFAPTNDAFAKLDAGTVETLLKPENRDQLAKILTYHVVPGKVMAGDIVKGNGATPTTVNGQALDVVVRGGKVYVNGAKVTQADIACSNGVIHVIDAVVLPK